jgi:DNA-binding beta-propeller fold protein YncE
MAGVGFLGAATRVRLLAAILLLLVTICAWASGAKAEVPSPLREFGPLGAGPGEIEAPGGLAVNQETGHLFVADQGSSRITEFTAWGEFVKAFGWDVSPGPVDEEQEVRVRATSGQFRLGFEGSETGDLAFDASGSEVETALNALPTIGGAGGSVEVEGGLAGTVGITPAVYVVRFGGSLAATDVPALTAVNGSTPLAGGTPATLKVLTRAHGTSGGTGLEACTAASGCKAASFGGGVGQFNEPAGLAVGADGSVYVYDHENFRIQKFDGAGRFLRMWGREVNKTTGGDLCTLGDVEGGDLCGAGLEGTGPGQFSIKGIGTFFDYLDFSPDGSTLYAGDKNRIQKFDTEGAFLGEISFAAVNAGASEFPAEGSSGALAVDPLSGDLYFAFAQGLGEANKKPGVYRLSPSGGLVDTLRSFPPEKGATEGPEGLATDTEGSVYVVERPIVGGITLTRRIVKFDSEGNLVISYDEKFAESGGSAAFPGVGIAVNSVGDVYVAQNRYQAGFHVAAFGPSPFALEPPPKVPPTIEEQFAVAVGTTTATVRAEINPHFWPDTRYYVEYGTADCSTSTCSTVPVPPGSLLTADVVDAPVKAEVLLEGLAEDTIYHYRFVAAGGGGGPVFGPDSTFTTARTFTPAPCPANEAFRSGASSLLPDCRAYEMVSPVDKNGGDLVALCENSCNPARLDQSALSGNGFTYSAYKAFGDAPSAPYSSQYLATRGVNGWGNHAITPPQSGPLLFPEGLSPSLDTLFKAFGPELETGWLVQPRAPSLSGGNEAPNLYRRDNLAETYEALVPGQPLAEAPELQGVTPDEKCVVFRVKDDLTAEALPDLTQVYASCEGTVTLVSILPDGTASTNNSSAGTPGSQTRQRWSSVQNAISDDGTRVFWSEAANGAGPLHLRLLAEAKTITLAASNGLFWGASADGSRAVYSQGTDLKEAQIAPDGGLTAVSIAGQVEGVVGMSEDASHLYFVSREDLDGGGGAEAGKPNLYLRETGPAAGLEFIAILSAADMVGPLSLVASEPIFHTARVTEDGETALFMSTASLTGFDNRDIDSGEDDAEIFRYDAATAELVCISCNPTGVRPAGRELEAVNIPSGLWAAAQIPPIDSQLYGSRVITHDGGRIFFESFEALVPGDANEAQDVYQWEEPGVGGCDETEANYQPSSGGCLDLISSGTDSGGDADFLDASPSGDDVFFATRSSLVPQDPGLTDIYDARVDGGFATPSPPPRCEGEACQPGVVPPPGGPTLPSAVPGPGNPPPSKSKQHKGKPCPRGKHKVKRGGKVRCVKNKKHRSGRKGKR